jgi:hypothetical protein
MALDAARQEFSEKREVGHVSDVIMCPRQRVFTELDPNPPPITDEKLANFASGKAIHGVLQSFYRKYKKRFEKEKWVEHMDIVGHVDLYDKRKNVPIEFKTTTAEALLTKPNSYNEEQIKYYMSILDSNTGTLIYQYLSRKVKPKWNKFVIEMDQWERKERLGKLVEEMTKMKGAIKHKDPSEARAIYDTDLKWLCYECPYLQSCCEMRPQKEIQKHIVT